jgi:hypothetical protein
MNNSVWKCLGLVMATCLAVGCGSGPRLYKAGGTVTYKGQPVDKAAITFIYDDGGSASGLTDATGKFQLVYLGKSGGTAAGKGSMMVTKLSGDTAKPSVAATFKDPLKMSEAEKKQLMDSARTKLETKTEAPVAKMELPPKYGDPKTSGLNYEILPKNDNNFVVELKD